MKKIIIHTAVLAAIACSGLAISEARAAAWAPVASGALLSSADIPEASAPAAVTGINPDVKPAGEHSSLSGALSACAGGLEEATRGGDSDRAEALLSGLFSGAARGAGALPVYIGKALSVPVPAASAPVKSALVGELSGLSYPVPAPPRPELARSTELQPVSPHLPQPFPACHKPAVTIQDGGRLYKDGEFMGTGAVEYKAGCTANVVWKDNYGYLYKNGLRLGSDVSEYSIAAFTGDAVWTDKYRYIYKNSSRIGSDARDYQLAGYTGDVVWTDIYNYIHKNGSRLGSDVREYKLADYSGDILWLDNAGFLSKNSRRLTNDPAGFSMDDFGKATWLDHSGTQHID
ncbi:MAG: hypothetical protein HY952_01920 [Elusimicrobia bacterium]|nr:hypothetical protein [Elusimicrobiota bacterium]